MNKTELTFFSYVFKALADTTRQRILELLRDQSEMTVTDITKNFRLAQPTVSQHLRVLKEAGVIDMRKSGQQTYYRLCNENIYDAMKTFMEVYKTESKKHLE